MTECPSRFSLVRMRAGDLPTREFERMSAHVASCASCRKIADNIEFKAAEYEAGADRHFAKIKLILETAEPPTLKDRRGEFWRKRAVAVLVPLAAAAAVAAVLVPRMHESRTDTAAATDATAVNFKGAAVTFDIIAKRAERQFKVEQGAVLMPDDALRFIVDTASGGYVSVFSVDEQRKVSPFYPNTEPEKSPAPMKLAGSGRHELPGSIILDDVQGDEYYVVVFSKNPFDRREVHEKIINENLSGEISTQNGPELFVQSLRVEKGSK